MIMKKFAEKHISGILISLFTLIIIAAALVAYVFLDFYAKSKYESAKRYLAESMYMTDVRRLSAALERNDSLEAYRLAKTAADTASGAGMQNEAVFMNNISEAIYVRSKVGDGQLNSYGTAVRTYLETKEIARDYLKNDNNRTESYDDEWEPSSVSKYREAAALECASAIVGVNGIMKPAEQNLAGKYLFTCRNAYVVIDAKSGSPYEVGISLTPSENALSETECVEYAENFIRKYFTIDVVRAASVAFVEPDIRNGLYNVTFRSQGKTIVVSVRRDSGKITRLITS